MRIHNNTIRKYTQALLNQLGDVEVQYMRTDGSLVNKKIPLVYGTREKQNIQDFVSQEFLETGNYSVLPRQQLSLVQLSKMEDRVTNKLLKKNIRIHEDFQEFVFNPVPYEFTFDYQQMCRGMNEAQQIIEMIQTKFNPTLDIDIWDQDNLEEQTRVPVKLLDIQIEDEGYSENSTNIITVIQSLSVVGNLYQPNTVDLHILDNELEPCSDEEFCNVIPNNSRVMPIIKQVGFSTRQSQNIQDLPNEDISFIGMFDVDEKGYVVIPDVSMQRYDVKDYQAVFQELKNIASNGIQLFNSLQDLEDIEEVHELEQLVQDSITTLKEEVFKNKNSFYPDTQEDIKNKFEEIQQILYGYDDVIQKLKQIEQML